MNQRQPPLRPRPAPATLVGQGPEALLEVQALTKHYPVKGGGDGRARPVVHALDDVSLTVAPGETVGLVGESGSGKSTLGRAALRLVTPSAGHVLFHGQDLATLSAAGLRRLRREMQMIFQDPVGSLNPRLSVEQIVGEPLVIHGLAPSRAVRRARVTELLAQVGLPEAALGRRPHAFSGGQRQRIGIARALATSPSLIVADEPVSALDVSIQAQIVNLLSDLQAATGVALLFVSHDLKVVRHLAHRIAVLLLGHLVEQGPSDAVAAAPAHPYTRALLAAVPKIGAAGRPPRPGLTGEPPSPITPPSGCRFHPRCPVYQAMRDPRCREARPLLQPVPDRPASHQAACHFPLPAAPTTTDPSRPATS